jgi:hypothetical protein
MSALLDSSPLPSRNAVRNVVEGMVGRTVELSDGQPVTADASTVTAVYVNDHLSTMAVAVVDMAGAARLGGALGLLPKGGIDDAITDKFLPENVLDNCYEVLNVLASVFNVPDAPHVKLYQMYQPAEPLPPDIRNLTALMGSREDVTMDISGYGRGRMSVVVR